MQVGRLWKANVSWPGEQNDWQPSQDYISSSVSVLRVPSPECEVQGRAIVQICRWSLLFYSCHPSSDELTCCQWQLIWTIVCPMRPATSDMATWGQVHREGESSWHVWHCVVVPWAQAPMIYGRVLYSCHVTGHFLMLATRRTVNLLW